MNHSTYVNRFLCLIAYSILTLLLVSYFVTTITTKGITTKGITTKGHFSTSVAQENTTDDFQPMFARCSFGNRFRSCNRRSRRRYCNAQKASVCSSDKNPATPKKPMVTNLFDGKTLESWKITKFGTSGKVEIKNGAIQLNFSDGCTGITWTKDFPKMNYEISLDAMRVDGNDFFCGLTFPVKESPCSLIIGGWGGGVVGLSSIDSLDASENSTTTFQDFENKKWYRIRIRVTESKIEAWIDKKKIVDLVTSKRKLSIRPEVDLSKPLGIASFCTHAALRNLQVQRISKPDTPAKVQKYLSNE